MPALDRWEQGSEFHWPQYGRTAPDITSWSNASWWGSGRDAFRALLSYGEMTRGWRRLWLPAYFCQEIVAAFASTGIALKVYPDGPQQASPDLDQLKWQTGDVMLRCNYFGLRMLPSARGLQTNGITVIDDHTHDPWSESALTSDADWCVASLRKTLPVPDGGILWSPLNHASPPDISPTSERQRASLEKMAAMTLKALYLNRHCIEKETFRRLEFSGESHIASGHVSGMPDWTRNLIETFPIRAWRDHRRRNHQVLTMALSNSPWLTVLKPDGHDSVPFSGIVVFDTHARREFVRRMLIEKCVYPAVLWPLDSPGVPDIDARSINFSMRMLSIHCDMRYDDSDMLRVASLIRQFGDEYVG